ncbi:MAG: hypothetical protein QM757_17290 [Paludibaculum sp.]
MEKRSRSEQARINGAHSRGPVTPAGKARSARNSTKHGRYAQTGGPVVNAVVLCTEDEPAFFERTDRFFQDFLPINTFERSLVRELATIDWEIDRISMFRTHTINHQVSHEAETIHSQNGSLRGVNAVNISVRAANKLIDTSKALQFYGRELTRLQKARRDVLNTLIAYRNHFQAFERSEEPLSLQELDLRNEPDLPDLELEPAEPEPAPETAPEPQSGAAPAIPTPRPSIEPQIAPAWIPEQPREQPPNPESGGILTLERRPAA